MKESLVGGAEIPLESVVLESLVRELSAEAFVARKVYSSAEIPGGESKVLVSLVGKGIVLELESLVGGVWYWIPRWRSIMLESLLEGV